MARNWIKIETNTLDKPEVCVIATFLKIDPDAALGKLVRLWSWAEVNKVSGNKVGVTKEFLDRVVGQKGFSDALEHAGWLTGNDGALVFTNFAKHNGKLARGRAQTAERVSRHRAGKRSSNAKDVNQSLPNDQQVDLVEAESRHPLDQVENVITTDNTFINSKVIDSRITDKARKVTNNVENEESISNVDEAPLQDVGEQQEEVVLPAEGADDNPIGVEISEVEDPSLGEIEKVRRGSTSNSGNRKAIVADPPDQPFLF